MVRGQVEDVSVVYYELEQHLWKGVVVSEDVTAEVAAQVRAGVPTEAPSFAAAVQAGEAVFFDGWDAASNQLPESIMYGAVAFVPILIAGEARRLLTAGNATASPGQPGSRRRCGRSDVAWNWRWHAASRPVN